LVYEADTLKELIRSNWSLTADRVVAEGTAAATGKKKPIQFYAHRQQPDKIETKAVEVIKITPLVTKQESEFFTRETDKFKIRVIYKIQGTNEAAWNDMEADVEDIEGEIETRIKATYNPQTGIGVFFTSDFNWINRDEIETGQKQDLLIVRELDLSLTRILSRLTTVFDSFQRGIFFDLSESKNLDTPPLADYKYTEVFEVDAFEGFTDKEVQVQAHPDGVGVPLLYSGGFSGTLTMKAYAKNADYGTTADKLNQIYKRQTNGEKPEIALLRTYTNRNSETLNKTTFVRVIQVGDPEPMSDLLTWQLICKIIKPSIWSVT